MVMLLLSLFVKEKKEKCSQHHAVCLTFHSTIKEKLKKERMTELRIPIFFFVVYKKESLVQNFV